MGELHKYECKKCGHRWEAWELSIDGGECEICGSTELKDLGPVDGD